MFLSDILFLSLAAFVLADPLPQGAATTDLGSSPTDFGSSPSELASLSDSLASLSSLEALESGIPTLASSVESVLLTAIPTSYQSGELCQTTTPGWYKSLPADVKSALSSYDSAIASWYSVHSAELNFPTTLPGNVCAGTVINPGSGGTTPLATASTAHATATGTVPASTTGSGTAASGTAASPSASKAAAPHITGDVGVSFAGILGVLGLIAAL